MTDSQDRLKFFYIKANQFRVVHVDGILGGITPRGFIHFATYSERPAIPQTSEHVIVEGGTLGPPVTEDGKAGIVREMDADLIMSKITAIQIRDWLTSRIDELEQIERVADGATETRDA